MPPQLRPRCRTCRALTGVGAPRPEAAPLVPPPLVPGPMVPGPMLARSMLAGVCASRPEAAHRGRAQERRSARDDADGSSAWPSAVGGPLCARKVGQGRGGEGTRPEEHVPGEPPMVRPPIAPMVPGPMAPARCSLVGLHPLRPLLAHPLPRGQYPARRPCVMYCRERFFRCDACCCDPEHVF